MGTAAQTADVIVVGAGPGGAATAHYLAQRGLQVVVLDKATFPRDKICGDGLTPRAVAELISMGVPTREEDGWIRNQGLRVIGGGHTIEMDWPDLETVPSYGLVRARTDLDETLIRHAVTTGATLLEGHSVTGAVRADDGRITGVRVKQVDQRGRAIAGEPEQTFTAPFVVDAGGVAARLATSVGREKRDDRPLGVAIRTYFQVPQASPRYTDTMMESHLELWDGAPNASDLLPGYGWIFALGNGLSNVGLGSVSSTGRTTKLDYKGIFGRWMANVPEEWGFTPENQVGDLRSAALPMAFNRQPLYADGLMLVGDSGGMTSPYNGEGIAYAMQAGRIGSDVIAQALARPNAASRERAMQAYSRTMKAELGGYYALGKQFVRIIEHPSIMRICTRYGLPRPLLMKFVHKLLSDSYDRTGGDALDRIITALTKVVRSA
ncbi:FAD-dependent oxidoreductase [Serinibacter arcticus]|uniref:FAD-dependent oxidoreductase n=1 Tax=Serinibacter arcticus TaxID=1655435 RepID=A0A2U1ZU90_9MICO|nr:geranylgeranyl reductase family protein [Serinibacter arcticus]PWD50546.1 FAD-dependent oxidoreductase [Serinibacter arcticus]